ncbi:MAG: hypothetical protein D6802_04110 [Ardenticatenia bacterium]|uniref:Uncharacterized protein n=1 Tax=Ardenticatena maritima TaxID=872965 RepID=A0A0M9UCY8_9CHLR|nr:hypothetical protein [Ardenticatena maritima]KPL89569.1 hypothetical protein SE16_03900 [Ardenticatena maritima]RME12475.1 MAG: hypothetical protein D6802_04110 [Ardenticatenia bacterium]GAP63357.1 hypothetical protein ARMA_1780 [Ardenticatena maritima]
MTPTLRNWHTLSEPALRELVDNAIYGVTYGMGAGTMLADAIRPFLVLALTPGVSREQVARLYRVLLEEVLPTYQQLRIFDPYHRLRTTINEIGRLLAEVSRESLNGEYPLIVDALADLIVNAWVLHEPHLAEGVLERLSPYTRLAVLEAAESAMQKKPSEAY